MSREYLVTPIPPLTDDMRVALGIHQSDIIIRTALLAGLDDLRANPSLLDYVFASLPKDALTYKVYGEEQVSIAKNWFLNTEIPVSMNTRVDESKLPCVTIAINESSESAVALGDVNYETSEIDKDTKAIVYGGPYTPLSYVASTGTVIMPSNFSLELFPGMYVRTSTGSTIQIEDVIDAYTFVLPANLTVDLKNFSVVSAPAAKKASLESREFRETYEIGCHVAGEPVHLTYLHSIVLFILLRYNEELLESRGLSRITLSSSRVMENTSFNISQPVFTRNINLTGFVHQHWPKFFRGPIEGITTEVTPLEQPYYEKRGVIPAAYPDVKQT